MESEIEQIKRDLAEIKMNTKLLLKIVVLLEEIKVSLRRIE